jgi:hypothetical protein
MRNRRWRRRWRRWSCWIIRRRWDGLYIVLVGGKEVAVVARSGQDGK